VLRFWNNEVLTNPEGVTQVLLQNLLAGSLHRGGKKGSPAKKTYFPAAYTLTRSAPPSAEPTDLSHEGEVNS
jgi:hypothetical protein